MIRFEDLLEKVRAYSPDADVELLRKAYVFSAFEHRGQVRHSGEPYLIHPLAVADFLADMKLDEATVAAGLLHDTVEDTDSTQEEIEQVFGFPAEECIYVSAKTGQGIQPLLDMICEATNLVWAQGYRLKALPADASSAGSSSFAASISERNQERPMASITLNGPISHAKPHSRARSTDGTS